MSRIALFPGVPYADLRPLFRQLPSVYKAASANRKSPVTLRKRRVQRTLLKEQRQSTIFILTASPEQPGRGDDSPW